MAKKATAKKTNAKDATQKDLEPLRRRLLALEKTVKRHDDRLVDVDSLEDRIGSLEGEMDDLRDAKSPEGSVVGAASSGADGTEELG